MHSQSKFNNSKRLWARNAHFVFIGIGGAIGAILRFGITDLVHEHVLAVLICNIVGSFVLACAHLLEDKLHKELKSGIAVGFCGGISIFASFSSDSVHMLRDGLYMHFALNFAANFVLCIVMVYLAKGIVTFMRDFVSVAVDEAKEDALMERRKK